MESNSTSAPEKRIRRLWHGSNASVTGLTKARRSALRINSVKETQRPGTRLTTIDPITACRHTITVGWDGFPALPAHIRKKRAHRKSTGRDASRRWRRPSNCPGVDPEAARPELRQPTRSR